MDSGNSGSLQSSSGGGGDDEFDSRGGGGGDVDSSPLSALLRPSPSPSAAAFSLHGSALYGLQEFASAPPQQRQQADPWSGASGLLTGAAGASSSSPRVAGSDPGARPQADTSATAQGAAAAHAPAPPRGSRKRTRASRRAPTTVLTTDTSNFRAMVQEFTGIPSPPFAAGVGAPAASLRTRFDHLFPSPSSLRSAAGAAADTASLPPYLLRPFAQKLPTAPSTFPPFTSSSSSTPSSSNIGVANANATTGTATTAAASSNPTALAAAGAGDTFQLTSSALLRLHDPNSYLSFQNLLDSQPSSQSMFGAAGGFAQAPRLHEPSPLPSEFLAGVGSGLTHGGLMGSEGLHLHQRSDVHLGGDELSGVVAGGGSCKLNYSSHAGAATSSSATASTDKPPDGSGGAPGPGRPGRGEGLDSWICTSE
ncbi:nuclear pore complex protein NUP62-like [Phragmites australis]|uniref:nuclear pore complex protein NUP62-like n=1 Tax=Phragmites australis TaxID=29695 RepID=UPI002D783D42|nr:nuclear pore complex protein NUP62-like [Phragmites australis]